MVHNTGMQAIQKNNNNTRESHHYYEGWNDPPNAECGCVDPTIRLSGAELFQSTTELQYRSMKIKLDSELEQKDPIDPTRHPLAGASDITFDSKHA